jgi:hypothetical protein
MKTKYRLKGKEGDIYSWIWFVLRAALFTTGGRASKGCHLTQLPKPAPLERSRCYGT